MPARLKRRAECSDVVVVPTVCGQALHFCPYFVSPSFTFPFRDRDFNSLRFDSVPIMMASSVGKRATDRATLFSAHFVRSPNGVSRRSRPFGRTDGQTPAAGHSSGKYREVATKHALASFALQRD